MNNWDWNDYDDFYEKYGPASNLEAFAKSASVSVFFTMVGILLKRKEIDVNLVDDTMRTFSMRYWEKFEPIITEGRIRFNFPRLEAGQEFLYNEMKKRQQQELKT